MFAMANAVSMTQTDAATLESKLYAVTELSLIHISCTMAVDDATGLCLEWRTQNRVSGYELSGGEGDFVCTAFATEDVVLPLAAE